MMGWAGMGKIGSAGLGWIRLGGREGFGLTAMGEREAQSLEKGSWGETSREHRLRVCVSGLYCLRVCLFLVVIRLCLFLRML